MVVWMTDGRWLFRPFGEQEKQWGVFLCSVYVLFSSKTAGKRTRCVIDFRDVRLLVRKRSFLFFGVSSDQRPCLRVIHVGGVRIVKLADKDYGMDVSILFADPSYGSYLFKHFFFGNGGWYLYSLAGYGHLCKRAFYRIALEDIEDI